MYIRLNMKDKCSSVPYLSGCALTLIKTIITLGLLSQKIVFPVTNIRFYLSSVLLKLLMTTHVIHCKSAVGKS